MRLDPEKLGAWLDGELGEDEARRIEAAVTAHPVLAKEADALRRTDAALREAYPMAPADDALLSRLGLGDPTPAAQAEVIDLAAVRAGRAASAPRPRWTMPGRRLAASIAVVALAGAAAAGWISQRPAAAPDGAYTALSDRTDAPRADVLVVLQDGADATGIIHSAGGKLVGARTSAGAWRVVAEPGQGSALLARLRADKRVVMAEPIGEGAR